VLEDREGIFTKRTRGYDELSLFLGRGLLTSEGNAWRRSRRVAAVHLHPTRIERLRPSVQEAARREIEILAAASDAGRAIDVVPLATRITLAVIGEVLVGSDLAGDADWIRRDVAALQESANDRIAAAFSLPMWLPLAAHRRSRRAGERVRAFARLLAQEPATESLLAGWVAYRDRHGARIDGPQVEDEVVTFLLAGHESTSNTLAWALHELAGDPGWDDALERAAFDGPLVEATFRETARLYPQGWSFGRTVSEATALEGRPVAPGDLVMVVPYATHRHRGHWRQPERFAPLRFLAEGQARHRYAYVPFSGGRRACVGAALAALEVQETLRVWLSDFRFRRARSSVPEPLITLRPRGGVWLVPERRAKTARARGGFPLQIRLPCSRA